MTDDSLLFQSSQKLYPLVTKKLFGSSPRRYNSDQWTLLELHDWKTGTLPHLLKQRHDDGSISILKEELVLLMQWKLAVGKFRPALPKLIASNTEEDVKTITSQGFRMFLHKAALASLLNQYQKGLLDSLKELCKLRGVGPATASLLLSLLTEVTKSAAPFFSDECFLCLVGDALRPNMPIKYNLKEYVDELIPALYREAEKTHEPMESLQRGAWALKTYEKFYLSSLSEVELPFKVDAKDLHSYSQTK